MTVEKSNGNKVITIDPVGRTEGHLGITVTVSDNKVIDAKTSGPMYRGFEKIMIGRDPREAQDIPPRVCGVCPMVHSVCGNKNIEKLLGAEYNANANYMRNIAHGTHMVVDHILHFYHLAGLDFVRGPQKPPFIPRYEGDYRLPTDINDAVVSHYIEALDIRRIGQEAAAIFAGKLPHAMSFVPGGVSETPTKDKLAEWTKRVDRIEAFVKEKWLPDVLTVAKYYPEYSDIGHGAKDLISFGLFALHTNDKKHFSPRGAMIDNKVRKLKLKAITEDVGYSWYDGTKRRTPFDMDETQANPEREDGYSFITAVRYEDRPVEVGPIARQLISGHSTDKPSVLSRHVARVQEASEMLPAMREWTASLELGKSGIVEVPDVPQEGSSYGLEEAPRGACGHWMKVKDGKISHWQTIPATNFNASPKDNAGNPGPMEMALLDTPVEDPSNPLEVVRVVRSFDPCLGCAVHVISGEGEDLGDFVVTK